MIPSPPFTCAPSIVCAFLFSLLLLCSQVLFACYFSHDPLTECRSAYIQGYFTCVVLSKRREHLNDEPFEIHLQTFPLFYKYVYKARRASNL